MSPVETVREFMSRINQGDADKLAELMTEDHAFIDPMGQAVHGREAMRTAWARYYAFCPDYSVTCEKILSDGNVVVAFGSAGGTIAVNSELSRENGWRIPAAWMAIVENDLVKEWRVYADNQPVREILSRSRS
jgi:ketosteroid isomerase-like protein